MEPPGDRGRSARALGPSAVNGAAIGQVYCRRWQSERECRFVREYHPVYTIVLPDEMPVLLHEWEEVLASEELPGGLRRYLILSRRTRGV